MKGDTEMKLSITIEGMLGLNWDRWKSLITKIEGWGFASLFRSDHFTMPDPPDMDSLETIVSLTYLACNSKNIRFGTLVSPLSFRDPVMLARQAMAIDDLSDGRMVLGLGAGWMEREHNLFGYSLGDIKTRMDRLEEGVEVISSLIRSEEPVTFKGHFYQLHEAQILPRPQRSTPILVGGNGPKRTLPIVARFADIWNCQFPSIELFKERSGMLDALLEKEGRQPSDVKRTILLPAICWRDKNELERRAESVRNAISTMIGLSTEDIMGALKNSSPGSVYGSPQDLIESINSYAEAGVDEIIIQWFLLDDIEGLQVLAEDVLPSVVN
jgi:alkanesulfonate monooxygenase SsuD/methylene tetrahydromethanopterin reductase-like flavin-dependent oxidoreductase (luciferase family)